MFQYSKIKIENGQLVPIQTKMIDQSKLTSECWLIQFDGLKACKNCELLNKKDCGGKNIRKKLLSQ